MDGKHAVTHYKVLKRLKKGFTYIECQLETGRTHQIRVHMASIKHPLLGDDVYGPKKSKYTLEGQCFMRRSLDSYIQELENIWSLKCLCQSILKNY